MPIARSTLAGAATGVVLLAAAVGFGVGLPKVIDDPAAATPEIPALPDKIDDRFKALSAVTPEDGDATTPDAVAQMEAFASEAAKSERETTDRLEAEYGDATVRSYLDVPATRSAAQQQQRPAQFAVTIVPGDPGLLIPSGPFQIEQAGTHYELRAVEGHRCSITWSETIDPTTGIPTGAEPTGANYQVECRTERDGLTYDLYSSGLTPEETVHYLDRVLELTEA